jgi:hypothetical protein
MTRWVSTVLVVALVALLVTLLMGCSAPCRPEALPTTIDDPPQELIEMKQLDELRMRELLKRARGPRIDA